MFGWPGRAYVYFIYGMYHCLNVTTEPAGIGGAVLIRAIEPTHGLALMRNRRTKDTPDALLARGPGNLCRAFGIDTSLNGIELRSGELMLELAEDDSAAAIAVGPRVGIKVAPLWPLRFADANSASVSNPRSNLRLLSAASDTI
jgi:DNA-3-methyladenine glycosylase